MKKVIIISFFLISVTASFVFGQSLQYNDYYKKSVEYSKLSQAAIDNGDYDLGSEHAVKSQEYAALSRQYIAEMLALFRAKNALNAAKERIEIANRLNYKTRDSELYNEALTYYKSAGDKLNSKDYENSISDSNKVIDLLKDIAPAQVAAKLAATYVVKLNPAKRDCLWRIAGYDFIYGNPLKWPVLYDANKSTFRNPNNPNLIYPGQILKIPSINGETRSGQR